jgi:thioredoxin-like negative regulator of GroEL
MAPMVHGLEAEYFGRIKFSFLDADDPNTNAFQRALGFYSQPELYILDADGKVLQKFFGYTTEDQLRTVFSQYLK